MTISELDDPRYARLADQLKRLKPTEFEALVATAPDHHVRLIRQVMAASKGVGWRADPVSMLHHFRPDMELLEYQWFLGQKFRQLVTGESRFQVWNLPARYGKSMIASQWGPAWVLDRTPRARLILTSYGQTLVMENADAVRTILESHRDELSTRLRPDRRARQRFMTSEQGGVLAAAREQGVTGFGAGAGGGVVMDDLFKDWPDAHSEAMRDLVWHFYQAVVTLRLDDESAFILIVMTRWHEDDLVGRIVNAAEEGTGRQFEIVRLPAIAEAADPEAVDPVLRLEDPLGRKPGETLGRFSKEEVQARSLVIGSYLTAALEQQRPSPEEGGELKRGWWKWYDDAPEKAADWASSWDMKLKDNEQGDFVVGQVWGRTGGDYWGIDQFRGQWNQATTRAAIALCQVRHPYCRRHFVENTGYGPEVIKVLRQPSKKYEVSNDLAGELGMSDDERAAVQALIRRGMSGLVPITVKGSKIVRAQAVSPILEAGNCHLPSRRGWALSLVEESAAFPNGTHDDQVDAWSQALSKMSTSKATVGRGTRGKGTGTQGRAKTTPARNVAPAQKAASGASKTVGKKKAAVRRGARSVGRPTGGARTPRTGP